MDVTVELRPHIGISQTELGPVEIEHDQYIVMVSTPFTDHPVQMGYIGKAAGAPFNGLHTFRRLPDELKAAVVAELERQKHETGVRVFEPPKPIDSNLLEQQEDDATSA